MSEQRVIYLGRGPEHPPARSLPLRPRARTRAEADQIAQTIRYALIDGWHSRRVAHGDRS